MISETKASIGSLKPAGVHDFENQFWTIVAAEFPQHIVALKTACQQRGLVIEENIRSLRKVCATILQDVQPEWPRYDRYLSHFAIHDPRFPADIDDESPSYSNAGELLAQRITSIIYMSARRVRFLENIENRPFWKILNNADCPGCKDAPSHAEHWQSPYWQTKQLPCEWLNCRSRQTALTEIEFRTDGTGLASFAENGSFRKK